MAGSSRGQAPRLAQTERHMHNLRRIQIGHRVRLLVVRVCEHPALGRMASVGRRVGRLSRWPDGRRALSHAPFRAWPSLKRSITPAQLQLRYWRSRCRDVSSPLSTRSQQPCSPKGVVQQKAAAQPALVLLLRALLPVCMCVCVCVVRMRRDLCMAGAQGVMVVVAVIVEQVVVEQAVVVFPLAGRNARLAHLMAAVAASLRRRKAISSPISVAS